jgi:hypothetical protein
MYGTTGSTVLIRKIFVYHGARPKTFTYVKNEVSEAFSNQQLYGMMDLLAQILDCNY